MQIRVHACVGGINLKIDIATLRKGVHIVVATSGRVNDLIKKGILKLDGLSLFILDEADEMLSGERLAEVKDIFQYVPGDVQVCLFFKTIPNEILKMTKEFMREPARILFKNENLILEGIRQYYIPIKEEQWKLDVLTELYKDIGNIYIYISIIEITQAIFYCNSREKVDWLTQQLRAQAFTVSSIHDEMSQIDKNKIIREFRTGSSRVLITTDFLAARGIDFQQVYTLYIYILYIYRYHL